MLDECSDHRGSSLGPQGEELAVAVGECVHFFFDNISGLPDAAGKKFGFLKNGYSYLLKTKVREYPPGN